MIVQKTINEASVDNQIDEKLLAWASSTFVQEAAEDGKTYGRKDASWVEIDQFVDAPATGSIFG